MHSTADSNALSPLLSKLLELLAQFEDTLKKEAEVLKSPDLASLSEVLQQKETLSESVSEHFEQLLTHGFSNPLSNSTTPLENLSLLEMPGLTVTEQNTLTQIAQKAKQCHKLNAINGITVQALRNLNQTTLDLLTGRDENGQTYTASGQPTTTDSKSNPLGKA